MRIGRLRPDTFELNLHAAPNGKIVGVMHRSDRFELDDRPPVRNPGGVKDWARGRVNMTGDYVWVALERLIVEVFEDRPAPPPPRPKPKPQPVRVRSLDVFGALIAAAIVIAILWMLLSAVGRVAWPYIFTPAAAQTSWCSGNCGASSSPWTLYQFMILDNGFKQQELSSHDTLSDCIAAFNNDRHYHQGPVVEARCVYINNSYPALVLAASQTPGPPGNRFYDYTSDLHRDCLQAGLGDTSMFGVSLCRVVKIEPLTKSEALKRKLQYRAVGWGKKFPADEDGYFIAESNEFIPQSWSVPSPDDNFHRCTYPLNHYWAGPPDNEWKIRAHNDTADGLPPTRCFWRPAGK